MRYSALLSVIFLIPIMTVAQANDYLWLQTLADEIMVVSTDRSLDRRVPTDIKSSIKMEVIKENQQQAIHVILDLVKEYEAQGWEVMSVGSGVWIFRKKE